MFPLWSPGYDEHSLPRTNHHPAINFALRRSCLPFFCFQSFAPDEDATPSRYEPKTVAWDSQCVAAFHRIYSFGRTSFTKLHTSVEGVEWISVWLVVAKMSTVRVGGGRFSIGVGGHSLEGGAGWEGGLGGEDFGGEDVGGDGIRPQSREDITLRKIEDSMLWKRWIWVVRGGAPGIFPTQRRRNLLPRMSGDGQC